MSSKEYYRYLKKDALSRAMYDLIETGKTCSLVEVMPHVEPKDQTLILKIFQKLDDGNFYNWHVRKLPQKTMARQSKSGRPKKSEIIEDAILSFLKIADIKHQDILAKSCQGTPTDIAIIQSICKHEELARILRFSDLSHSSRYDYLKRARDHDPIDEYAFDILMLAMAKDSTTD